jgi:hypothetical protein
MPPLTVEFGVVESPPKCFAFPCYCEVILCSTMDTGTNSGQIYEQLNNFNVDSF